MDDLINSNQESGEATHQISEVSEADEERLTSVEEKINQLPKLLNETAGREPCCIFRLPKTLVSTNKKAYEPQIISIGPYHHGKQHLKMIQEHKWPFLRSYISKMEHQQQGVSWRKLVRVIAPHEVKIREAFSETINMSGRDLIEMMILDGCFIMELFCKVHRSDPAEQEPILTMAWTLSFIARDLLKLENQIPFFLLEILFEQIRLSLGENFPSLKILTLGFFNSVLGRPVQVLQRYEHLSGKHILDLFRSSLIPPALKKPSNSADVIPIQSAEKLHLFGIRLKPRDSTGSFLDITFDNGVLQIPTLTLDDFCSSLLQNCVAFEQCYNYCSNDVTTYAAFMCSLISTSKDAEILCDKKLIKNYFAANEQVTRFFNNLGKDLPVNIGHCYLTHLFEDVNDYSTKGWHLHWAGFVNTYFPSRWSIISAIVGFLIVVSAVLQASFTVYPHIHFHKNRKFLD